MLLSAWPTVMLVDELFADKTVETHNELNFSFASGLLLGAMYQQPSVKHILAVKKVPVGAQVDMNTLSGCRAAE